MIGWVDVETTGLTVDDDVLEVAVVITDDDLVEVDVFEQLVWPRAGGPERWRWLERIRQQPEVLAMHTRSGLITAILAKEGWETTAGAEHRLDSWLGSAHGGFTISEPGQLVLAGASVGFDRKMLEQHMPDAARWFHYRSIDVSSIKELAKRWAPDVAGEVRTEDRPHRALADIRETIDLLRRYRASGFIGAGHPLDVDQLVARIESEAARMDGECSRPPCQHAQGLRLAIDIVRGHVLAGEHAAAPVETPDAEDDQGLLRRDPGLMRLISGKLVNPLHLHVDDVDIYDIAHALARQCRYNGHVGGFLSVARHSIWVADHLLVGGYPDLALAGLLHDASEAYLGDMVRPLKHGDVGQAYRELEASVEAVIAERFGLPFPMPEAVMAADNFVLTHVEKATARASWSSTPDEDAEEFLTAFHRLRDGRS